ncbi:hypothetical protein DMN91_003522 [Ooceraea biroi]|uniref:Uncharacterized protein n=1 Tax=Ooceraea biroi TaxID=2015173 RepID=A0A3L8DU90_OOCBI|nr:uncharacterized protein LOC105286383 [Ooceraea biroi]RLU23318.1 hypothetical protein DMN91_003522 [Ooceraea biroi]
MTEQRSVRLIKMNIFFSSFVMYMILLANTVEILTENNDGKLSGVILSKEELQSYFRVKRATSDDARSELINREFDKIIEFINVLDEVDNFIYDKTKTFVRKLNAMYDVDETERYHKSRSISNPNIK